MPYTIDPSSADCYPCTSVLINKFDLHSQQELDRVEAVLVTCESSTSGKNLPLCSTFDFEHYKAIPPAIFSATSTNGPVYPAASTSPKRVRSSAPQMRSHASALLFSGRLAEQNFFQSLSFDDFVDAFVDFYIRTNELHPFREGNGRTTARLSGCSSHSTPGISWIFPASTRRADGRHHLVGAGRGILCCASFFR